MNVSVGALMNKTPSTEFEIDFEKGNGLLPVITQDYKSKAVLMFAYMTKESFKQTLECGEMVYYSRSRQKLWHKGETSGNRQKVIELRLDCDNDTLLALVEQKGEAACHTGRISCFYRVIDSADSCHIISEPIFDPKKVYKN